MAAERDPWKLVAAERDVKKRSQGRLVAAERDQFKLVSRGRGSCWCKDKWGKAMMRGRVPKN